MTIFFNSWENFFRVFITLIIAYPGLIILLRLAGKRSLAKMNMFDFIITVAFGSTFASLVLSKEVTLMDGILAFGLLLTAQYLITYISLKSETFQELIKSDPTLLFRDGEFLEDDMRKVRVTEQEILAEIRLAGIACLEDVYAVVMETNGEISVLNYKENINQPTLKGLSNYDPSAMKNVES